MPIVNTFGAFYLRRIIGLSIPKDLIRYSAKRHRERIALVQDDSRLTYGELYNRSMKLANALIGLGLGKGDRLGVLLYNCPEYFEVRIAAYFAGIVLVPIIWDMPPEDAIFILNNCEAKCLIYHPEILKDKIDILKKNSTVRNFVPVTGKSESDSYEGILSRGAGHEPDVKLLPNDPASINFSSGTTGRPKGVLLLQGSWMGSFYNMVINAKPRSSRGESVFLHTLSLATSGSTSFLTLFFIGAKQVIMKRYNAAGCIDAISKNNVNTIYVSPSVLADVMEYIKDRKIKPGLSVMFVGTENFPYTRFKEAIETFGPIIRRGYGMVECLPPVSLISPDDYLKDGRIIEKRLRSCGRLAKGVGLRIVDERGGEEATGNAGKIALRSSAISSCYWKDPPLSSEHYRHGWFYTNDYGYLDEEGYLYLLGRLGDKVETGTVTFFTGEIEDVLNEHPAVKEACAVKTGNASVAAAISLKRGYGDVEAADIMEFCEKHIGKNRVPQEIRILKEIPMNASCKLDRQAVRKVFV